MTALPFRFDDLLAHGAQVDALARQLCRDEHAAADAVQDTWVAALRHGRPRGKASGFLAAVLRNVVRMRGRTERRAELRHTVVAARERLAESAADAAARVELQRFVAGAVLALPEPQRSLVLLHYFEGRPVAALARDHRLTADAVRAHLRRARDTLRQRLRTHEGPARGAFAALLLAKPPLLPWLAGATLVIGMKTQWFVAAAVAAVVVAFTCWQFSEPGPDLRRSSSANAGSEPATAVSAPAAGAGPVAESTVRTAVDERSGAAAEGLVRCQLVGLLATVPWTTPLEVHVEHWSQPGSARKQPVFLHPDAHGAFAIEVPPGVGQGFGAGISANDPNYADFQVVANFVLSHHATAPYELRVQPVSRIVGTVVDFRGTPVRDALVAAFAWVDGKPRGPHTDATTGDEGQFRIKVPMETDLFLVAFARTPAGAVRDDLLPATARVQARFGAATATGTLTLPQPAMITGELRDPQGRPVPGEFVYWWPGDSELDLEIDMRTLLVGRQWHELITAPWAKTDERGRFRLAARTGQHGTLYFAQEHSRFEPFTDMRQVTVPADVSVQLAGNTAVLRVVRRGAPVKDAFMVHEKFGSGEPCTDEHGELRLLREHAAVQKFAIKTLDGASVRVELPLDTAPDRPIVIDVGDIERAAVTFDVTSAIEVQQFAAIWRAAGASSSNGTTVTREGGHRCEVAPGDYNLSIHGSNRGEGTDRFVIPQTLQVVVPPGGTRVALTLRHGGRIRLQVRDRGGVHLAGSVTLVGPDGVTSKPGLDGPDDSYARDGRLPGNGPVVTSAVLAPGTWQLTLDLGRFGIHRRTVEVRACMVAEVDVTVQ